MLKSTGGTLKVASAASDGIHANDYFQMSGGSYISANTTGDGIDADAGYIKIKDGLDRHHPGHCRHQGPEV